MILDGVKYEIGKRYHSEIEFKNNIYDFNSILYLIYNNHKRFLKPLSFIFKKNKTLYFSKQKNRENLMLSKEEKSWNLNIMF